MNRSRHMLIWILIAVALPLTWAAEAAANPAYPRSTSRPQWLSSSRSTPAHRPSTPVHRSSPAPQRSQPVAPRPSAPVVRQSQPVQYSAPRSTSSAPQRRVYMVHYRECSQSPWVAFGGYYHRADA